MPRGPIHGTSTTTTVGDKKMTVISSSTHSFSSTRSILPAQSLPDAARHFFVNIYGTLLTPARLLPDLARFIYGNDLRRKWLLTPGWGDFLKYLAETERTFSLVTDTSSLPLGNDCSEIPNLEEVLEEKTLSGIYLREPGGVGISFHFGNRSFLYPDIRPDLQWFGTQYTCFLGRDPRTTNPDFTVAAMLGIPYITFDTTRGQRDFTELLQDAKKQPIAPTAPSSPASERASYSPRAPERR